MFIEALEDRCLMAADMLRLGTVYIEEDVGSDQQGDAFLVTFEGGAADSELQTLIIDGNQDEVAFGVGDVFFDIVDTLSPENRLGADHAFALRVNEQVGIDDVRWSVEDGSTRLRLEFDGFHAGDRLVFSIDVDEVEEYDPAETDPQTIEDGLDPITSGVEFQGSQLIASFSAPHFRDAEVSGEFRNRYDDALRTAALNLPRDDADGKRDRTAAAFGDRVQSPLPVSLRGSVFEDLDLDLVQQPSDPGLAGVELELWREDAEGTPVFTGHTTSTDALGRYAFGTELNLAPGVYEVRERQPAGYFSVGAIAGTLSDGRPAGQVAGPDLISRVELLRGDQHAQDLDFAEASPAAISGYVYHDQNQNVDRDPAEHGIPGSQIQVIPIRTVDPLQGVVELTTDSDGRFDAQGLSPGEYRLMQVVQPPGYIDAEDAAGTVDSFTIGAAVNPGDEINAIHLNSGQQGVDYRFGEILPGSIQGAVFESDADGNCFQQGHDGVPIADVTVDLYDQTSGQWIATTKTDESGAYAFPGLQPGKYRVVEHTPSGLIDGPEHVGFVNGRENGLVTSNDEISDIVLASGEFGVEYDFCEHRPSELSGFVFHDQNDNGRMDDGELGIADVEVALWNELGDLIRQVRTDASGSYQFSQLSAGNYSVRETHPAQWLDGKEQLGTIAGVSAGQVQNDRFTEIGLGSGVAGRNYNFGELLPAEIHGRVQLSDSDGNCFGEYQNHAPVAGARIQLFQGGTFIAETVSDQDGQYAFVGLAPGVYSVVEITPEGLFDGGAQAGSVDGRSVGRAVDAGQIDQIVLASGDLGTRYDFCETQPSSLSGWVHVDPNRNCLVDDGDEPIAGVRIELWQDQRMIDWTVTDGEGRYRFDDLHPGEYSVKEIQPDAYFQGTQRAGTGGGEDDARDQITRVQIGPGQQLEDYRFCEVPPARLSGYVFRDGAVIPLSEGESLPEDISTVRDGQRTPDDLPLPGVTLELREGIDASPILGDVALPGYYGAGPIRVVTDADGYYEFPGLPYGNYSVYEVQPEGYVDGVDTPGSTPGIAINPGYPISPAIMDQLTEDPRNDAIVRIQLPPGVHSQENNFSEVSIERIAPVLIPNNLPPVTPVPPAQPIVFATPELPVPSWIDPVTVLRRVRIDPPRVAGYTWHLSVTNGGYPRGTIAEQDATEDPEQLPRRQQPLERPVQPWQLVDWVRVESAEATWSLWIVGDELEFLRSVQFGPRKGRPVAGDFNGDGTSEVAIFVDGYWMIDLNGSQSWDSGDMWARLGYDGDLPVSGDWDGDGKEDIGIFGRAWPGDPRAIASEPGLPDEENQGTNLPKNLPPEDARAARGRRSMQVRGSGAVRTDVIDHVFHYGVVGDAPVTGDWNGDGIHSIGLFRDGIWHLDVDGDGRWTDTDLRVRYGRSGDIPISGDWNGDGIDDIGVFRAGTFYLDSDGNSRQDDSDLKLKTNRGSGQPVVGDWNGDGRDDVGLKHNQPSDESRLLEAEKPDRSSPR